MSISLNTDILPGKERNPFLEAQMRKIADALNTIGTFVLGETAALTTLGANNIYRLAQAPLAGSVAMYDAGLRVDPTTYTVQGRIVTILTASITGPTLFDYRY